MPNTTYRQPPRAGESFVLERDERRILLSVPKLSETNWHEAVREMKRQIKCTHEDCCCSRGHFPTSRSIVDVPAIPETGKSANLLCPWTRDKKPVPSSEPTLSLRHLESCSRRNHYYNPGDTLVPSASPIPRQPPQQGQFPFMRLPTELRDMVYGYLTDPHYHSVAVFPGTHWSATMEVGWLQTEDPRQYWGEDALLVVFDSRKWASILLFQICKDSRNFAIKKFGTPNKLTAPFDPTRDVIQLMDHHLGHSLLQQQPDPVVYPLRGIRNASNNNTNPVRDLVREGLEHLQQAQNVDVFACGLQENYEPLAARRNVSLFLNIKHLGIVMDQIHMCALDLDEFQDLYFEPVQSQVTSSPSLFSKEQIDFLETFLWDFDAGVGTEKELAEKPELEAVLRQRDDPMGLRDFILDKVQTLELRTGKGVVMPGLQILILYSRRKHLLLHNLNITIPNAHKKPYFGTDDEIPRCYPHSLISEGIPQLQLDGSARVPSYHIMPRTWAEAVCANPNGLPFGGCPDDGSGIFGYIERVWPSRRRNDVRRDDY